MGLATRALRTTGPAMPANQSDTTLSSGFSSVGPASAATAPSADQYADAMLDHVRVMVKDVDRSRSFYARALAPLGYRVWHESVPGLVGLGPHQDTDEPRARIWLREGEGSSAGTLISLTAQSRQLVDTFHATALQAGGVDGGGPELRAFHPTYYSAYITDPDGVTLEVVCHQPE